MSFQMLQHTVNVIYAQLMVTQFVQLCLLSVASGLFTLCQHKWKRICGDDKLPTYCGKVGIKDEWILVMQRILLTTTQVHLCLAGLGCM